MKIVLDARWIFPEISGIGRYTQELIRHLLAVDRDNAYVLLFDRPEVMERTAHETGFPGAANARAERVPCGPFAPASQWIIPARLSALKADVYHSTNYMLPFLAFPAGRTGRTACVATIHDLIPLLFPHYTPRALKTRFFPLFRRVMRETGRRADMLLVPSESTRKDVIGHLRIPAARHDRIVVVPEGVGDQYSPRADAMPERRCPPDPVILYVGRFDPYKNVPALVEAFAALRPRVPGVRLRIIGPQDARYPEARERARALTVEDAIEWSGYVSPEELVEAYRRAAVFALPSRYEGFGLPVLEAMACGTPVVCGRESSLPEVAGDAALLVDPQHTPALADALARVLTEPALAADLARRGLEHAARFTWQRTATATVAVYRRAAALRPS